jgi:Family of unknown function (DUF6491)
MLTTILFLSLQAATAKPVDARECLPLREIKSQQAIDDSNIVFTLRNGKSYKNTLDAQCWGLKFENRFSIESQAGQMCKMDQIRVIQSVDIADHFRSPGSSCTLGYFMPYTLPPKEKKSRR